jgi:hypothetical protein
MTIFAVYVRRKDVLLLQSYYNRRRQCCQLDLLTSLFFLLSFSFMGPAEVAAWGILGFLWETFENITGKSGPSFKPLSHVCGMG